MIKVEDGNVSISGRMITLLAETEEIVHAIAGSVREAAQECGLDEAEKLKEFADSLADAIFLSNEELIAKKKKKIFDEIDDDDHLPEGLKKILHGLFDYLEEKKGEKDGDNDDGAEEQS